MSSLDRPAYNQHSSGGSRGGMNQWMMQQMEQAGMRPIYSSQGGVRTMATSMRAPLAGDDTMHDLTGITGAFGSPEHDAGWGRFFNQHAPPGSLDAAKSAPAAGSADIAADEQFDVGGTPTSYGTNFVGNSVPPASAHVGASIAQNSRWLGQQGIAFPPPPTNRFPGDEGTGTLATTQSFQRAPTPTPLTGPMGNAGSDAANLAQNKATYAAGGWKAQSGPANWPSGWQTPGTAGAAAIASKYGSN